MKLTVELKEGDVVVRRTRNGWILETAASYEGEDEPHTALEVFEDTESKNTGDRFNDWGKAESLSSLLWSAFQDYYQSKHSPGLSVGVSVSCSEEESNEEEQADFEASYFQADHDYHSDDAITLEGKPEKLFFTINDIELQQEEFNWASENIKK